MAQVRRPDFNELVIAATAVLGVSLLAAPTPAPALTLVRTEVGYTVLWDPPLNPDGTAQYVEFYRVNIGTASGALNSAQEIRDGRAYVFIPPEPTRTYYFSVQSCVTNRSEPPDPLDEVDCSAPTREVSTLEAEPAVDCATQGPSVFVTRWTATTNQPGSRMFVSFQISGKAPIVQVQVKVNGLVVASSTGITDLQAFGSMWFTAPSTGTYPLSVKVVDSVGCPREALSPLPLRIR